MKRLLSVITALILLLGCESNRIEIMKNRYDDLYLNSCKPLLNNAKSQTDSLLVYMFRPTDSRFGESCQVIIRKYANYQAQYNDTQERQND